MKPWPRAYRFRPRSMVRWLSPREVTRGAYGEFFGRLFGAFADNRETQASLRSPVVHHCRQPDDEASLVPAPVGDRVMLCNDQLPWHCDGRVAAWAAEAELIKAGAAAPSDVEGTSEGSGSGGLWLDYVADIGDGFSGTFTVAEQMARPVTAVADGRSEQLPPADLIVFGGDAVYPAASQEAYRDRTVGPYRTAFPGPDLLEDETGQAAAGPDPVPLFSIPGNHDWYDGLSAFLERFTVYNSGEGVSPKRGWSIHQTRSYFAAQLTDRWWLWGIDIALTADIDTPQMMYFRNVASIMPADSRIILCTAKPSWLKKGRPSALARWGRSLTGDQVTVTSPADDWDQLTYFIDATLGPSGVRSVRLALSGDKHFLAMHSPEDPRYPTVAVSGGGGGYLSSTRESPENLDLNWYFGEDPELTGSSGTVSYPSRLVWPSRTRALLQGIQGLWLVPWRNPEMAGVLGVMSMLFALAARAGVFIDDRSSADGAERLRPFTDDSLWKDQLDVFWGAAQNIGGWAVASVMALALFAMAKAHRRPTSVALVATVGHLLLHAVAATITGALSARWAIAGGIAEPSFIEADSLDRLFGDGRWPTTAFVLFCLGFGSLAGIVAFALYLVVAQFFTMNLNELFAGLRSRHYKQFLRLHVSDHRITATAVGFPRVPKRRLDWSSGLPRVSPVGVEPEVVGRFVVEADPARVDVV